MQDKLKYCFSSSHQEKVLGGKDVKGTYMGKERKGESRKKQEDFQSVCSSLVSML